MSSSDPATPTPLRPPMQVGGGFIVLRRAARSGRLRAGYAPFEHGSRGEAEIEAARLAAQHRREFVVFQAVTSVFPPVDAALAVQSGAPAEEAA